MSEQSSAAAREVPSPAHRAAWGWAQDDQESIAFYDGLLKTYGPEARAVNWGSAASQERRFQVLAELVALDGRSLLDVGAGHGALYGWLEREGYEVAYRGVDAVPAMVAAARARFPQARFDEVHAGALNPERDAADIVFASGLFTERRRDGLPWMEHTIERLYRLARVALVYNCLATIDRASEREEFRCDPEVALRFAQSLHPRAKLKRDYHPGDFTIEIPAVQALPS